MANTYTLISSTTVPSGSGSSSVSFTSIPSTYTDLCIKFSARVGRGVERTPLWMRVNSDTGTNYHMKLGFGTGTTHDALAYNLNYLITGYVNAATSSSSVYTTGEIYITNYTGSGQKPVSNNMGAENNSNSAYVGMCAGRWTGTSAINSITFLEGNEPSNILQYSTFSLYGIKNS